MTEIGSWPETTTSSDPRFVAVKERLGSLVASSGQLMWIATWVSGAKLPLAVVSEHKTALAQIRPISGMEVLGMLGHLSTSWFGSGGYGTPFMHTVASRDFGHGRAGIEFLDNADDLHFGEAALAHDVDLHAGPLGRKSTTILGLLFGAQTPCTTFFLRIVQSYNVRSSPATRAPVQVGNIG
jgi:hypothetical protein